MRRSGLCLGKARHSRLAPGGRPLVSEAARAGTGGILMINGAHNWAGYRTAGTRCCAAWTRNTRVP